MDIVEGSICAPKGFIAGGIRCGIKPGSQKKDLALIYSKVPAVSAAVFTTNKVKAASVIVTQQNIVDGKIRAVIANSGNANACTGEDGMKAARRMAQLAADAFLIKPSEVAVASTGVIGVPLPIAAIENGISKLKASLKEDELGSAAALEAIMTTDTRKKEIAVEIEIDGKPVRIGAITKGSGMIHPNMATMLCFITTDAAILPSALVSALRLAVKRSFNRLTVDGDTSTNDMAIILANGEANNAIIVSKQEKEKREKRKEKKEERQNTKGVEKKEESNENYKTFYEALEYVCVSLARMMARDGEGATKLLTVSVSGAKSEDTAETLAKSVAASSLVKAAIFGADANWGRVLCAMGYAGADFSPEQTSVSFKSDAGVIEVCKNGESVNFSEELAKKILSEEEIEIVITLQDGDSRASAWGCDLTYDYVKINGDYRS